MKLTRGQTITTLLCIFPLLLLGFNFISGQLSANPIQDLTLYTGRTSIYLLLLSLLCSPIRNILHMSAFLPIRKILGVFSFIYALLHFTVFIGLDFQLKFQWFWPEILSKLFLQIGLAGLVTLILLAVTSIKSIQKNLGKSWGKIHKLVYPAVAIVIFHIFLTAKGDYFFPIQLSAIFTALMLFRLPPLGNWQLKRNPIWLKNLNQFLLR